MGGALAAVALLAASLSAPGSIAAAQPSPTAPVSPPRAQNPSPMVESTRAHERLPAEAPAGATGSRNRLQSSALESHTNVRAGALHHLLEEAALDVVAHCVHA